MKGMDSAGDMRYQIGCASFQPVVEWGSIRENRGKQDMVGTLVNTAAIVVGGVCGHLFGRLLKERHQETLTMACGVGTLFLGIAGAMNGMLRNDLLPGGGSMLVIVCLALGGLIGEILFIHFIF